MPLTYFDLQVALPLNEPPSDLTNSKVGVSGFFTTLVATKYPLIRTLTHI